MRVRVTRIQGEFHRGCRGSVPSTFRMVPAASRSSTYRPTLETRVSLPVSFSRATFVSCHTRDILFDRACADHVCARNGKKRPRLTKISFRSVTRMQPPPRAWRVCARNKCLARSNRTETIRRQRNDRMFSLIPCRVTRI